MESESGDAINNTLISEVHVQNKFQSINQVKWKSKNNFLKNDMYINSQK